jgi:hypothetical protein
LQCLATEFIGTWPTNKAISAILLKNEGEALLLETVQGVVEIYSFAERAEREKE